MPKFPKTIEIEVFRGGTQTDSAGNKNEWTEAKLDKIVAGYKETGEKVPACISKDGHPENNQPAFGWFSEFKRKGNSIWATLGDINKNFAEMLRNKTFKNRSIALRNNLSPRHVAFLGAMAPAIKGLADYNFKEGEEYTEFDFEIGENEFSDFQTTNLFHAVGRSLQGLRDFFIQEKNIEMANKVMPQWEIDMLKSAKPDPDPISDFKEQYLNTPPSKGDIMPFTEEQFKALEAKNLKLTTDLEASQTESKTFSETADTEKKRADANQDIIDKSVSDAESKGFNEIAEGLVNRNKIMPAEKTLVFTTLKTLKGQPSYDFTEADGTVTKRSQFEDYKKMLENKPEGNLFSEKFSNGGSAAASKDQEILDATNKIIAEKSCGFSEARTELMETRPELFKGLEFTESN